MWVVQADTAKKKWSPPAQAAREHASHSDSSALGATEQPRLPAQAATADQMTPALLRHVPIEEFKALFSLVWRSSSDGTDHRLFQDETEQAVRCV